MNTSKIQITNLELVDAYNFLNSLANKRLPQKVSYPIVRNLSSIKEDFFCFQSVLNKIFSAYSDKFLKNPDGSLMADALGIPKVSADVLDEYQKEITDLTNIEVEINLFTIDEDIMDSLDFSERYDVLTPNEIMKLEMILCHQNKGGRL